MFQVYEKQLKAAKCTRSRAQQKKVKDRRGRDQHKKRVRGMEK